MNRNLNLERGRYFQWIRPLVFITHTDFNEMVYAKVTPKAELKEQLVHNVKMDIKLLHNVHQGAIHNFAVQIIE